MIISSKNDVIQLSGSLNKNQWLTIKAAANLLMREHPEGIIIDCGELTTVSEDGAKTFLDAMKDIQAAGARMVVSNLPENVLQVVRSVPGVRSQLPIAATVEEARQSLRMGGAVQHTDGDHAATKGAIVLPLMPDLDVEHALTISGRLARDLGASIHLVYLLEVARHLPIGSPLAEQESAANAAVEQGVQIARKKGLRVVPHIERVRAPEEGLLQLLRSYKAGYVVLGAFASHSDEATFHGLVDTLLHRAPCNVLIGRRAVESDRPAPDEPTNAPFEV